MLTEAPPKRHKKQPHAAHDGAKGVHSATARRWSEFQAMVDRCDTETGPAKELTSELAAASLDNALDSCDVESFMKLLGEVIKARLGYGAMARSAGLNRTALYKIASPKGNPAFHTLVSLLTPLGFRLSIKVITGQPAGTRPELSDVAASQSSNGAYAESSAEKESSAE